MTHVLVIDDDPLFRDLLRRTLTQAGFSVALAADGRAGCSQVRQRKPDLVITDILMPEMEGIETIFQLREIDANLPILAVSGGWTDQQANLLGLVARLGATETLEKPFRAPELLHAIGKCLGSAGAVCCRQQT